MLKSLLIAASLHAPEVAGFLGNPQATKSVEVRRSDVKWAWKTMFPQSIWSCSASTLYGAGPLDLSPETAAESGAEDQPPSLHLLSVVPHSFVAKLLQGTSGLTDSNWACPGLHGRYIIYHI